MRLQSGARLLRVHERREGHDGRATTEWFGESMLEATEDDRHPGCPVFVGMKLPEGAVVTE
ncbi:hypothetical protein [Escherichia coli]|uniref:hypothetical protein n=1 Tax=Escherichia coli TaxID=562 RepID=UPI00178864AF|nr:hypothetical protein [Escherichia coli]EHI0043536.1 hypothetical protein [Escherichia coli]MBE0717605.1 hypothetical protein [Escherichia coli]